MPMCIKKLVFFAILFPQCSSDTTTNMFSIKRVYQATEENRAEEQNGEHEEVNYPCGQCNHQATSNGNLAKHKREVHEGVKYSCGECGRQFFFIPSQGDIFFVFLQLMMRNSV